MRSLILVAAISALAWARPETYKETEEFQYARSSSDEGSKSGYYGAQRGNVAGNYEKAHNMDSLAQHQMSGAINQVQGELGDAAKTRAGSVYTAANSRGVYGSGHYDLSNLQGRNFGESSSSSSSHSALSSAYNQHSNSDWRSQSQQAGFGSSNQLGQSSLHSGSLHAADTAGYGSNLASNSHSTGYHSASGYNSHSGYNSQANYDQSSLSGQSGAYGTGDQSRRYTIVTPVRLVGRPGTQIAIPVYGQAGYDAHRASSSFDHSASNRYASQTAASSFDQNAINSEAEVLNNNQQHVSSVPANNGKSYSSSYNYHKAWERHSETTDVPVAVAPTANPLSINSELYEDVQGASGQNVQQSNAYNSAHRQNSYSQSGSSQSSHQSDYRSQHSSQADANANAYTQGAYGSHSGHASLVDTQPKSYQSSYSYHKSWEKQGDPYVIVPGSTGEASQRIVSANTKNSASAQRYGSQRYSQGSAVDCDSLCRYRRATRSVNYYQHNQEDLGQQAQSTWDQSLSQQTQESFQQQSAKLEDLGQQTQDLEDFSQQTQQAQLSFQQHSKPAKLEDLGQQTQNLEDFSQQTQQAQQSFQQQSQNLEDLGQQTQNLEDLGQQTQQSWGNIQQQSQSGKLEDFGQQTQGKWHGLNQNSESKLEDLGQQTQQSWNNIEQQASRQNLENLGQHTQGHWDNIATDNQQSQQTFENLDNLGQQTQSKWDNLEGLGQQTQQTWNNFGNIEQQNKPQQTEDLGQQTNNKWDNFDNLGQQVQTQWGSINKTPYTNINTEQQTQTHFGSVSQVKPNKEHARENNHNTLNKDNSNGNNPDDLSFWGITNQQRHENNHYNNQNSYSNYNSHSNSQAHGVNWGHHVNNNNAQTTHNNPLQSLWDKLDNMEEQSEHSSNENQQTEYQSSQHSYRQESTYHHDSNWENSNSSYHWNQQETHYLGYQPPMRLNSTIEKPKKVDVPKEVTPDRQLPKGVTSEITRDNDDESSEEPEPAEEPGRGDIGAEGVAKTTPRTVQDSQTYTTKPEKSPEEIEALSLSRGTEEITTESNSFIVLSSAQHKWLEIQRKRTMEEFNQTRGSRSSTTTSTTTIRSVVNKNTPSNGLNGSQNTLGQPEEQQEDSLGHHRQSFDQQNTEHKSENFGHQVQNLNQQTELQFQNSGHLNQNFDQQNTGQQLEDFGQQTQDLSQQNVQPLTNLGQHTQNVDQQNTDQQSADFGQQTQDLSQQNTEQHFEDFGQQSQDLSQQNLQQFHHLGQHTQKYDQQNTEQKFEDFGQQTQDLSQQNLQQFHNLGQQSQKYDKQNTEQQSEDFGQQTQDLSQQNLQQFHNLDQQSQNYDKQNTEQQFEDFGQQTQDLSQQNVQQFTNLEQHSQSSYHQQGREFASPNTQPIQEQKITPASVEGSQAHPKQEVEIVPPAVTTTEKPGFWRSVGSKFTNAKDSVASWFRRS